MTNGRGWGRAGTIAIMGITVAVTAVGCPGCPPETKVGPGTGTGGTTGTSTTPLPANPLVFTASEGSPVDCVYTYDTGAPGAPTFTLNDAAKGITVKATYSSGTTTTGGTTKFYDSPPASIQITYGDSSTIDFDTGTLSVSPTPGAGVTLKENRPKDWTVTAVGSKSGIVLNWGKTWTVTLSCGAVPSCCQNTPNLSVTADGTF